RWCVALEEPQSYHEDEKRDDSRTEAVYAQRLDHKDLDEFEHDRRYDAERTEPADDRVYEAARNDVEQRAKDEYEHVEYDAIDAKRNAEEVRIDALCDDIAALQAGDIAGELGARECRL